MEAAKERSGHGGGVNEEKRNESSAHEEGCKEENTVIKVPPMGGSLKEPDSTSSTSRKEQDDQLQSARAEMREVREENQRLKKYLDRMTKDYQTLEMKFRDIVQQEGRKSRDTSNNHQEIEEPEFVSLRLGRTLSDTKKEEKINAVSTQWKEDEETKEGLSLGLDYKLELSKSTENQSPVNSSEEVKEEARETWAPSKALKRSGDDEAPQHNPVKKARVCVRARCDTPTMNDGCQWRKYGQKIAKGNPCPRAYYRCTIAPSCPVRKQVQRFAQDMTILITTYEGTHNHPLPMSATAMASTTSAAASMLLSGSSSSSQLPGHNSLATSGLNYYLSDDIKSKQFYLPNNSSFSSSVPSCPTITLDLTSAPSSSSSTHFNRLSSNYPPRYSSTSLNFSSSESNAVSWPNGFLSYGSTQPYYNRNQIGNLPIGRQIENNIYQSYMQKTNPTPPQHSQQENSAIAAATKAITADPSFQSALVAALSSIMGTGGTAASGGALGNHGGGDNNFGQKSRWGSELFQAPSTTFPASPPKGNGCASSFLNETQPTTNSQPGSLVFLPPSLPLSTSKSASASPSDNRDHTN